MEKEVLLSGREMLDIYKRLDYACSQYLWLSSEVEALCENSQALASHANRDHIEDLKQSIAFYKTSYETHSEQLLNCTFLFQQWIVSQPAYLKALELLKKKNVYLVANTYSSMQSKDPNFQVEAVPFAGGECPFPPPFHMEKLLEVRLQLVFNAVLGIVDTLGENSFIRPSERVVRAAKKFQSAIISEGLDADHYNKVYSTLSEIIAGRFVLGSEAAKLQQVKRMAFKFALLEFSHLFASRTKSGEKCRHYPEVLIEIVGVTGIDIEERNAHRWIICEAN